MLALVLLELVPEAFRRETLPLGAAGTVAGGALMFVLALTLGV